MTITPKYEVIDGQPFIALTPVNTKHQAMYMPYDELDTFVDDLRKIRAKKRDDDMQSETLEQKIAAIYDNMSEVDKLNVTDDFRERVIQAKTSIANNNGERLTLTRTGRSYEL